MADENFVDSPWVQLGVPLAAIAASAIAPRHAGVASEMALQGLGIANRYNIANRRLKEVMDIRGDRAKAVTDFDSYIDEIPIPPGEDQADQTGGPAPLGGNAPEVTSDARTKALESGVVPKQNFSMSVEKKDALKRMNAVAPAAAAKFLESEIGRYQNDENAQDPATIQDYISKHQLGPGVGFHGIKLKGSGTFDYDPVEPPPITSAEEALRRGNPEEKAAAEAAITKRRDLTPPEFQHLESTSGDVYKFNPRLGTVSPARLQGTIAPPQGHAPAPAQAPEQAPAGVLATPAPVQPSAAAPPKFGGPSRTVDMDRMDRLADALILGKKEGRPFDPKKVFGLRQDLRSTFYDVVLQKDPTFDIGQLDRQLTLMNDAVNGKIALNKQSFGTFFRHGARAKKRNEELSRTGSPILNMTLNQARRKFTGSEELTRLETVLSAFGTEYQKFLLNGGALYQDDREEKNRLMNADQLVSNLLAGIQEAAHVAADRFGEMNFRYKEEVGQDLDLSASALAAAQSIGINPFATGEEADEGGPPQPPAEQGPTQPGSRPPITSFYHQ